MLIALTNKKEFKRTTITNFKMLEVNVKGWYCPINGKLFMMDMDGYLGSGVCGENVHTRTDYPWWNCKELVLNNENNNICTLKRSSCFCGSDIQIHKAINEETYDWFLNNFPKSHNSLPYITKDDKIISVGYHIEKIPLVSNYPSELHFHIGKLCNFDCRYCPSNVHNNSDPHESLDKFKTGLDLVTPHMKKLKSVFITGGEPTLNPELPKMIEYCKKLNYNVIEVNTNGTASFTKLTNLLSLGIKLNISFHQEFSNKKLMQKIGKLARIPNVKIHVKVMSKKDSEFSQLVKSYMPDKPGGKDIMYNPIYIKIGPQNILEK